jgi:hypothetical protein
VLSLDGKRKCFVLAELIALPEPLEEVESEDASTFG